MQKKKAILIINLGSPDSPRPKDVRGYLTEFLNDPRVIDLPWLKRKLLVNGVIVPFRFRKSAAIYKKLWTENGSPLIHHGIRVQQLLQRRYQDNANETTKVFLAMRYQNPSIESALTAIKIWNPNEVVIVPLFPQYASASTGSVVDKCMRIMRDLWTFPNIRFVTQFYDHPLFIKAFVERGQAFSLEQYDHVLFSYHGLPERHVDKVYEDNECKNNSCEEEINDENKLCYKATCYATTRLIASGLGLRKEQYTVCFQSRLGKGWIEPFSDEVIIQLAKNGNKKLLVFSPAFVADCLETIVEIGDEYQELFNQNGGEKLELVPSLNDSETWIDALYDLAKS